MSKVGLGVDGRSLTRQFGPSYLRSNGASTSSEGIDGLWRKNSTDDEIEPSLTSLVGRPVSEVGGQLSKQGKHSRKD